jgi:ABC-type branched-subunit amino acid transport system permease subunit
MKQWPLVVIGFVFLAAWPLMVHDVFYQRIGALVLLAAISASAWNLLGGYAGPAILILTFVLRTLVERATCIRTKRPVTVEWAAVLQRRE